MKDDFFQMVAAAARAIFGRLDAIRCDDPELTPANWCRAQPCARVRFGSREILLTQPTSTFLVYLLGVLTAGVGVHFLWIREGELSRLWWGVSLMLWGAGALLAGTSYQAFGYQIKCAGRRTCAWTSWWEVVYLVFQQVSMDAMLVAVAYSCTGGTLRTVLLVCALAISIAYIALVLAGAFIPVKSLITFELMVIVSTPILLAFIVLNGVRYNLTGDPMDLVLLGLWGLLVLSWAAYWVYDLSGITSKLWDRGAGVWFSQNDVLHVCLIAWAIYIAVVVAPRVRDYSGAGMLQ